MSRINTEQISARAPAVVLSENIRKTSGANSLNEAALALTRSLGRRGVPVYRFHPDRSLSDLKSRYCIYAPCPNLCDDPQALLAALVRFAKRQPLRPVLFAASDGSADFIAANEDVLGAYFGLTSPTASCIAKTQNKQALLNMARDAGIDIPETYFPTAAAEIEEISRSISFPAVIKPLYSTAWRSSRVRAVLGQVKALTVENAEELGVVGRKVLSLATPFMVQEVVPGPEENLLTFIGYVGHGGRALAGCVRKKLRQAPADFGYCTLSDTVDNPDIMSLSIKLLGALRYRGIGCVEFKRDPRTGQPKLVEVNTRAVRTSALAIAAGVDFPWIAYQDTVNPGSMKAVLKYKVPVRWIHLYDELKTAGGLMIRNELRLLDWLAGFSGKPLVIAEFSGDDIWPAFHYWCQTPRRLLRAIWRQLGQRQKSHGVPVEGV
jgi:D-aspartate ligase